jgi:voltage-gated potassium channel
MANSEQTPVHELPTIEESLRDLGKYGYRETPPETLRLMATQVEAELEGYRQRAVKIKAEVQEGLESGNSQIFVDLKKKQTFLRGDIEECLTRQQRINNALEHQHLMAGMTSLLGSARRVQLLEGLVLSLIIMVLALLVYDFTVPEKWGEFNLGAEGTFRVADPVRQDLAWVELSERRTSLRKSDIVSYQTYPGRPDWLSKNAIFTIDAWCCLIFMIEFFMRRSCANSKKWFWRNHWIDFFTSIPVPGEAQLARFGRIARVARFARILRFARVFRALRVVFLLWRGMDKLQDTMDVKLMKRSLKWGMAILIIGGLLVYQLEHNMAPEGNDVTTVGGGIWWSFTTIVTGGYADIHNPKSLIGRILTVLLVITGMILVGVFTATLTSLYVGEESAEMQQMQDNMIDRLDQMEKTIADFSKQVPKSGDK